MFKPRQVLTTIFVFCIIFLTGCSSKIVPLVETSSPTSPFSQKDLGVPNSSSNTPDKVEEITIQIIPLSGPIADPKAEISGMAWYKDQLILVPQFPDRFDDHLFRIPKTEILQFLQGLETKPLEPKPVNIINANLKKKIKGFEGFESITFRDNDVFMTIESKPKKMLGYLIHGIMDEKLYQIKLDSELVEITPQATLDNYSDESILNYGERIFTIYEANGGNVNSSPVVHVFSLTGNSLDTLPFPNIEFRITDASAPDSQGRFWAINYLFPLDESKLDPADDILAKKFGQGATHQQNRAVERLVAFQITEQGIKLLDMPPIQLELDSDMVSRNWEGLVQLDESGFLLATDKYPQTLLGYVPWNFNYP